MKECEEKKDLIKLFLGAKKKFIEQFGDDAADMITDLENSYVVSFHAHDKDCKICESDK